MALAVRNHLSVDGAVRPAEVAGRTQAQEQSSMSEWHAVPGPP